MQIENKKVRGCMILEVLHKHTANSVAYIKEVLMRFVHFPLVWQLEKELAGNAMNTKLQCIKYKKYIFLVSYKVDFL